VLKDPTLFPIEFTSWLPRFLSQNVNLQMTVAQLPRVEQTKLVGNVGQPQFKNGWVNYGAPGDLCGFYKNAFGQVFIVGVVASGTVGTTIFTLPPGYRPQATCAFPGLAKTSSGGNYSFASVLVQASGDVIADVAGGNASFSLAGITFRQFQ